MEILEDFFGLPSVDEEDLDKTFEEAKVIYPDIAKEEWDQLQKEYQEV